MKLKPFVFPVLYISLIFTLTVGLYFTSLAMKDDVNDSLNEVNYVSSVILENVTPVANVDVLISNPYLDEKVKIEKYYYNLEDDIDRQKESLIYYDNTYMPNTGVDYLSEEKFDILAIYDGTVIDIKEDEMLGKIIEVRHDNDLISSYAGLSEISVQKGETIQIGKKIGVSGTNKLNNDTGNHLHLEIYKGGENIDPNKIIGKKIDDI